VKRSYGRKAEELKATSLASAMETVEKLEHKLAEFAKTHKHAIQHDPEFRSKFLEMCAPLGVDPLSAQKGFWDNMLGIGEFYVELSVKVAEVCLASRSRNGGIIRVSEVKEILERRGTKFQFANSTSKSIYTEEDIITSIKKLAKLGSGFRTVNVGRVIMIVSVPEELDADHMQVLNYAEETPNGMVRTETLSKALGWDNERSNRALELLLGKGMAWLDTHRGETNYWFPSLWKQTHVDSSKVIMEC
jgi:ESCRT-II complex subunit VPS22